MSWSQKEVDLYKREFKKIKLEYEKETVSLSPRWDSSNPPFNYWDIDFTWEHLGPYLKEFNEAFWDVCYKSYCDEFDTLNSVGQHTIFSYKVQKTLPGGGYHIWHCEQECIERSRRLGTYTLFLNDVVEGGETEFLYQNERVAPKEGRLVIFPSSYTHTHRGNPPLRGVKYIMTGWIEFS